MGARVFGHSILRHQPPLSISHPIQTHTRKTLMLYTLTGLQQLQLTDLSTNVRQHQQTVRRQLCLTLAPHTMYTKDSQVLILMILEEYTRPMEIIDSITSLLPTVRFLISIYHMRAVLMLRCILRLNPMAQYTLHIGTTTTCITERAIFLN